MTSGAPGAVRAVTRLLLIRHAETEANATGRTQGRLDLPLTARGAAQAAAVAESIAAHAPVAVFASPARRAVETAEAIAMRCGVGVRLDERLLEMDHGDLDGLTGEELRAAAPELLERWRVDPSEVRMPGGETLQEAQRRMLAAAEAIAAGYQGQTVAVVSHNLALHALLCRAMAVPLAAMRAFRTDLASTSLVEVGADGLWTLVSLNVGLAIPGRP